MNESRVEVLVALIGSRRKTTKQELVYVVVSRCRVLQNIISVTRMARGLRLVGFSELQKKRSRGSAIRIQLLVECATFLNPQGVTEVADCDVKYEKIRPVAWATATVVYCSQNLQLRDGKYREDEKFSEFAENKAVPHNAAGDC